MSPLALSLRFLQAQPDGRLIALAREGHEPAFEVLVRRYRRELLAYCRRLQPRSGSAEDALQQTLLQAWRALKAGAEVRDVQAWLYRIAHNVTLDHLRVAVAVPQELAEAAGGQEVHQLVEQRLEARAALAGMASLPALQRDVLVSTTLNGASHEEVASALGLSTGAVRGLIYRARATLRSAAAALTPIPALHWAIRRAESQPGGARAVSETLAGGGGASVAAAVAKSGAVLTVAGAVAGAGGLLVDHGSIHHRRPQPRFAAPSGPAQAHSALSRVSPVAAAVAPAFALPDAANRSSGENPLGQPGRGGDSERGRDSAAVVEHQGGASGASTGEHGGGTRAESDGGSATGSSDGSDGGSLVAATASTGGSSGGSGAASGGSDGVSSGSSGGSAAPTSASGTSAGGTPPTAQMSSDGGVGSDGGSTSTSPSSSGSGETTTTTGSH
jgi:RNA polymerase sigma factor (sigma-70 family)